MELQGSMHFVGLWEKEVPEWLKRHQARVFPTTYLRYGLDYPVQVPICYAFIRRVYGRVAELVVIIVGLSQL